MIDRKKEKLVLNDARTRSGRERDVMSKVLFCPCSKNRKIFNGTILLVVSDTAQGILFPAEGNKQECEWHNSSSLVYILLYKSSL